MNVDITPLIEAIMAVASALIAGMLVPWIKSRLSAEQYARAEAAYSIAVYAAEEIYRAGHGEQKLEYARNYLEKQGIAVDMDRLKAAVNVMRSAMAQKQQTAGDTDGVTESCATVAG